MTSFSGTWDDACEMASGASGAFGVVPVVPQDRPRTMPPLKVVPLDIRGRPISPPVDRRQEESDLGAVKHRPPPPDVMRVMSSVALVAALILSLAIQCVVT